MSSLIRSVALLAAATHVVAGISLDVESAASIKQASTTLAYNLVSYYHNNGTNTSDTDVGTLGRPYYWWEAAGVWSTLIDYAAYTNDTTYNPTVLQALQAQVGPNDNYMPPAQTRDLGNDDQSTWALACLDALEYGFPNPASNQPQWLDLAVNVFNTQAARWDATSCNGGLKWQIFSFNQGYDYKNSMSNGQFFVLAARLARYTGNSTYSDWAQKTWDWMSTIGLLTADGHVFDGTDDTRNCTVLDHVEWSINAGLMLYGSAILYNTTNGSSTWHDRAATLLSTTSTVFVTANSSSPVLTEYACELNTPSNCNTDQLAFKSFAARYLSKATVMAPFLHDQIKSLMTSTALAAAKSCTGGASQTSCGTRWYTGSYDGSTGVGQEMSALSVIQSLLLLTGNVGTTELRVLRQGDASSASTSNGTSTGSNGNPDSTSSNATYHGSANTLGANSALWQAFVIVVMLAVGNVVLL